MAAIFRRKIILLCRSLISQFQSIIFIAALFMGAKIYHNVCRTRLLDRQRFILLKLCPISPFIARKTHIDLASCGCCPKLQHYIFYIDHLWRIIYLYNKLLRINLIIKINPSKISNFSSRTTAIFCIKITV